MPKISPQQAELLHLDRGDKTTPTVDELDAAIYPESEVEIHLRSNRSSKACPIRPSPVLMDVHAEIPLLKRKKSNTIFRNMWIRVHLS